LQLFLLRGDETLIILGIDPGTATTGYGVIETRGSRLRLQDYGVIRTAAGLAMEQRLAQIYSGLGILIDRWQPQEVAIEQLFFNRNTTTAMAVSQARGVMLLACAHRGLAIGEYTPLQVKQAVVGEGRAEKQQVQYMVRLLLKIAETPKPDDAADALAIAICHAHFCATRRLFLPKEQ